MKEGKTRGNRRIGSNPPAPNRPKPPPPASPPPTPSKVAIRSKYFTKLEPGDYVIELPWVMSIQAEERLLKKLHDTFQDKRYRFFILSGTDVNFSVDNTNSM